MKWIKSHKLISFLLAVILLSLVVLVGSVASGGQGNPVSGLFNRVYAAIEKPFSKVAGGISDNVAGFFSYKDLQKENEQLKEENEQLKQQLTATTLSANELQELERLSEVLNYEGINDSSDIVSAKVITMDGTNWMNIFTINAGTESGIEKGDVVVSGDGLVGRISSVGKGWAKVSSMIDQSSKITFKVSGNLQMIGVVEGTADGKLTGFMLDSSAKVAEGDRLQTSGIGVFPEGIEIGKITKVKYDSDKQLQTVTIKASVDFNTLQKVSVIL